MGEIRMDKIDISYDKNYKIYAGQSIYIYPRGRIEHYIKTRSKVVRLSKPWDVEQPKCVLELENNIKATILPTLGSLNFVKYNQHNKMFYQFIQKKDFDKKQELKCLSKVEGENKDHLDEFYSKAAEFTIINFNNKINISKKISNEIIFDSFKMDNFGAYICKDSNYTKFYNKNIISLEKIYFIPENGTEIILNDVKLEGNISQYAGCQRSYKPFSSTIKIKVDFIENNKSSTVIGKFPTLSEGIEIENNQVIYKDYGNITNITIQCEYETVFNTIFSTKQNFIFYDRKFIRYKTKVVKDSNNSQSFFDKASNSMLYIISFVLIVIFFCTVIVIIVVVMKKRKKRKLKTKKGINKSDVSLSNSLSSASISTSSQILSQSNDFSKNVLKKKGKKISNGKITSKISDLSTTTESASLSVSAAIDKKKGSNYFSNDNKFRITAK
ncbi:Hypothetical protein SRAE_2000069100 [Strongyloides ratti]|uniref:Uncharacterized protein n=1 Tax=Strongyloides ratti TaxID=34506 RepID=A0A090LD10_STRRB|nr:Hypothetical protein SRAE_2000069100 [Strongyloides ratti]CEF66018.1 Hypothetical protein SRAE_2000069100 [Strongyloides ratti]